MSRSNLIELTYYDPGANVRLTTYADTIITEPTGKGDTIAAVRFGGYPEMVRAMSDAIYGGGSIDFIQNGDTYQMDGTPKAYRRQLSHDGAYATATLMINDEALSAKPQGGDDAEEDENEATSGKSEPPNGQDAGDLPEQMERRRKALAELHGGEPQVNTSGKIPEADVVFLDEIFKCNDGVLNSLLTALNERKYTNEGHTYPIPTVSFFAASNEIPNFSDPQEKILEALYDRLELKVVTENIADRDKRLAVLRDKQASRAGQIAAAITLNELRDMQREVTDIPIPDAVNELADDILCQLRKDGVIVSDRKYLNYYPIAQAKAWLSGHQQVESGDLLALKNYLWQKPGERAVVASALERMCVNPMQDKVNSIRGMAMDVQGEFEAAVAAQGDSRTGSRALIKLRGELVRLFGMQQSLAASVQSDSEKTLTDELLNDMEQISRKAHEAIGFTYTPLEQLAALQ